MLLLLLLAPLRPDGFSEAPLVTIGGGKVHYGSWMVAVLQASLFSPSLGTLDGLRPGGLKDYPTLCELPNILFGSLLHSLKLGG